MTYPEQIFTSLFVLVRMLIVRLHHLKEIGIMKVILNISSDVMLMELGQMLHLQARTTPTTWGHRINDGPMLMSSDLVVKTWSSMVAE